MSGFPVSIERKGMSLEQRLRLLEDQEDIRRLRQLYHVWINAREFDKLVALFTDDAVFEIEGLVRFEGGAEIDKGMRATGDGISLIKQFVAQHVIDVDGDRATGIADLEARYASDGVSIMASGRYHEVYVRTPAGWRIKSCRTVGFYTVPLNVGWAGEKLQYIRAEGGRLRASST